ncbi:hypothetical protein [Mesorhizobium retamae]|uniref:Uncharacterized protein n=1 Tax=Mesorhizobium retamae TaxID=2912854 RepID=A0ABS9Q8U8_9HYPH|nr:hypothetical protein [Mesorhizobium sp. IRAMC:0171]MCG7503829.1 hypothetical protein [Mesorhizobium sp. IRAMC:0171]
MAGYGKRRWLAGWLAANGYSLAAEKRSTADLACDRIDEIERLLSQGVALIGALLAPRWEAKPLFSLGTGLG